MSEVKEDPPFTEVCGKEYLLKCAGTMGKNKNSCSPMLWLYVDLSKNSSFDLDFSPFYAYLSEGDYIIVRVPDWGSDSVMKITHCSFLDVKCKYVSFPTPLTTSRYPPDRVQHDGDYSKFEGDDD